MAATAWQLYNSAKKYIGNGTITLGAGVFKMVLAKTILKTPAPNVMVPLPIYFLALLYSCHAVAAMLNLLNIGV